MLPSTPAAAAQELSALNTCNTCATVELWSLRGHLCPRGAAGGIERVNDGRPGDPGRPPGLLGMWWVGKRKERALPERCGALELTSECAGRVVCRQGSLGPLCPGNPLVIPLG